ncbi:SDR family NAD(P)-dependent oxidoreductase [Pollutimonas harenae]|uniref:SDR family oxidoreductase n=1 Tax=Pollutimonas harenae TaxID=657015 RepID=A0A853GZG8_9BURK|nr:SDR family oxidoreductase [Pollutimonas harenae]NYT84445.1 SDR family oxidoreductase [Pollutimonas harenae]TEA73154.1 SDR family oxidoreductase [Pollutimonas harenae]
MTSKEVNTTPLAIVTGGGTGLGLASGIELRKRGYRVIAVGLDTEPELDGTGIEFIKASVTDEAAMRELADKEVRVDVLVNAAGIIQHEGREHTLQGFGQVVDVNLNGTFMACTLFRDALAQTEGSIVNFASMWSYFGSPRNPGYSASKGAVVSLTRSLAVAYAPQKIRVNAVAPGWIETRMSVAALTDPERGPAIGQRVPLGFWGKPYDVAKAAVFLASADARYITGVILPVDGGFSVA